MFSPSILRRVLLAFGLLFYGVSVEAQTAAKSKETKEVEELPFSISAPVARLPELTALRYRNISLDAPAGRVVLIGGYITVAAVGAATANPNPLAVYDITFKTADNAFEPRFSPDGKTVLFRYGWPWDAPYRSNIYLLDLQTHKARRGPFEAGNSVLWSPNSRFLACPAGSDLFVYDLTTDRSRRLMHDEGVASLAWTQNNTLLFTRRTPPKTSTKTASVVRPILPAIYEVAPTGSRPQLVLEGGSAPMPSPDGQWLVYFGSPTEPPSDVPGADEAVRQTQQKMLEQVQNEAKDEARLCLYDRIEKTRLIISKDMNGAMVRWTPDSKKLVMMKTTYDGRTGDGQAQVFLFDLERKTLNLFTTLQSKDDKAIPRDADSSPIQLLQVSNDGKNLIVLEEKFLPSEDDGRSQTAHRYIRAVNLSNGSVIPLAQIYADLGLDWHDESVP